MANSSPYGLKNKENSNMGSPRRRRLKKILKLRRKQVNLVEQEAATDEVELPTMVDEPVVKEEESGEQVAEVLEEEKPVEKKAVPKKVATKVAVKAAPKKAIKKDN